MQREALGLIEVIGYPPAIEAADAALKAANVKLASITKVDGGIMTVQIMGDVGAVQAAVAAGGLAASRIGPLRATHVIPRVDTALFGTVLKLKTMPEVEKSDPTSKPMIASVGMPVITPTTQSVEATSPPLIQEEEAVKIILPPKMPTSKEVEMDARAEDEIEEETTSMEEVTDKRIAELEAKSNSELRALIVAS
ncbi:MAG: BMC domain-containing protein, partial [Niameybacter sp.]